MIGFWCGSPYHLLIVLHMCRTINKRKVLFLYDTFPRASIATDVLRKSGIFETVVFIRDRENGRIKRWYQHIFMSKELKDAFRCYEYENIIFFGFDIVKIAGVIKFVKRIHPKCNFSWGEDGVGSYIGIYENAIPFKSVLWMRCSGMFRYISYINTLYLTHPNLLVYKYKNLNVKEISKISYAERSSIKKILSNIFGECTLPDINLLILQQPFGQDNKKSIEKKQNECIRYINDNNSLNHVYIKLHPRETDIYSVPNIELIDKKILFELAVDERINMSTILTVNSTAALTPFLLWGYTPKLIFLYRFCGNESLVQNMSEFISKFTIEYEKEGGIIKIPANEEVLYENLF